MTRSGHTDPGDARARDTVLGGAASVFVPRGGGRALDAADRHVERWAPEDAPAGGAPATGRRRWSHASMRWLGFVDRLISPWLEAAQRSASLRMFAQYSAHGMPEREGSAVSWVFPRPWFQDELDWMAAARLAGQRKRAEEAPSAPALLTTRGTFVAPDAPQPAAPRAYAAPALPAELYEYVAPSLSVAAPVEVASGPLGAPARGEAYSSLLPLAAVQAAELAARAIAPALQTGAAIATRPALRTVLSAMLARASAPAEPARIAARAPELVTPPAPRAPEVPTAAGELVERVAEQRAQLVEIQRVVRESAARAAAPAPAPMASPAAPIAAPTAAPAPAPTVAPAPTAAAAPAEAPPRVERSRDPARMHEHVRAEAAAHARAAAIAPPETAALEADVEALGVEAPREAAPVEAPAELAASAELASALAALPPELARILGERPDDALRAIGALDESLRTIQLLAHSTAADAPFTATRGPRLVMPAGLGGLVAAVDRARAVPAIAGVPARLPLAAHAAAPWTPAAPIAAPAGPAPAASALGATLARPPVALAHVAWADRWLARFAGASQASLDTLSVSLATGEGVRLEALAAAAPGAVFVRPVFDAGATPRAERAERAELSEGAARATPPASATPRLAPVPAPPPAPEVARYDDDAETPDDVFAAIFAAATQQRVATVAPPPAPPVAETRVERPTVADAVTRTAPTAPHAGLAAQLASSPFAQALRHVLALPAASSFDVRALFGGNVAATYLAGLVGAAFEGGDVTAAPPSWLASLAEGALGAPAEAPLTAPMTVPAWDATYVAPAVPGAAATLATARSALLSWEVPLDGGAAGPAVASTGSAGQAPAAAGARTAGAIATPAPGAARALLDAMARPMATEGPAEGPAWMAPGMVAERAHAWSVAQERSSADLALDFVTPELVLAARVYGLGPAEVAQAARLALAGPGALGAMASTVDRAFVQAMAIHRERGVAAQPRAAAVGAPLAAGPDASVVVSADGPTRSPIPAGAAPSPSAPAGTAFGVARRPPRGAFLWPAAAMSALGIDAAPPDGEASMTVAALEMLAAQTVAEIGTYAALVEAGDGAGAPASAAAAASPFAARATLGPTRAGAEPDEVDVLEAAATLVAPSRRARFDALYVALGQSSAGRTWSPAARAARALALAGHGEESVSARERAALAWDVLPVVYATDPFDDTERAAPDHRARGERDRGERRSARAGEALATYVSPSAPPAPSASSDREPGELGAVRRAPTAAQELVRPGRPGGRFGGGEPEIPAWFESAARRMLEERSGGSAGISLAELTLVAAAPASQIAASTKAPASAAPAAPASAGQGEPSGGGAPDVEQLANEIYRHILVLMDAARARNGEPYL